MPHETLTPAYIMARFQVPDVQRYRSDYGRKVLSQVAAAGGKLLVASPSPTVLEGDWGSTWTALIQFPDRAAALRWYQSPEYAPLKKLRLEALATGGTVALFDGYEPPSAVS